METLCNPHMLIDCGHSFCFECIHSWLTNNKNCPACRTDVLRPPTLNLVLCDQIEVYIEKLGDLEKNLLFKRSKGDPLVYLYYNLRELISTRVLETFRLLKDPWKTLFPEPTLIPIEDEEDGVIRCPYCHWEMNENMCSNCDFIFEGDDDDEDRDEFYSDEEIYSEERPALSHEGSIASASDAESESDTNLSFVVSDNEEIEYESECSSSNVKSDASSDDDEAVLSNNDGSDEENDEVINKSRTQRNSRAKRRIYDDSDEN